MSKSNRFTWSPEDIGIKKPSKKMRSKSAAVFACLTEALTVPG